MPPMHARIRGTTALSLLALAVTLAPPLLPPARAAEDEVVAGEVGRTLDEAVQRSGSHAFWGAVLVAKDGKVLLAKGYGSADYGERPNTANTLFEIASTSKPFTAAAILKLEMEGKLKTSDKLSRFFRKVPPDKRDITIHHLLTHTSGIPGDAGVPYASPITRKAYAAHVLSRDLVSTPGEVFAYNNAAYALLAAIVEEASRTTFEKYSKKKLFRPAGLEDTGFIQDKSLDKERVSTRRGDRMPEATATDWHWGWGYRGMGGVVSTVHDLYRWDRALQGEDVLDDDAKAKYYDPSLEGYACGWRVDRTDRGTRKIHHSGGVHGYACQYARFPEDDAVVVILSNGKSNIFEIEREILQVLFPPPVIRAELNVGHFKPNEDQIVSLPDTMRLTAARNETLVILRLEDGASGTTAASIHLPVGPAKKLEHDLTAALEGREARPDASTTIEAGMYLQPYRLSGPKLMIDDGLSLMLRSQYVGKERDGTSVVDDRITLSVVDSLRRQWPVMVKMGDASAKQLLEQLREALR